MLHSACKCQHFLMPTSPLPTPCHCLPVSSLLVKQSYLVNWLALMHNKSRAKYMIHMLYNDHISTHTHTHTAIHTYTVTKKKQRNEKVIIYRRENIIIMCSPTAATKAKNKKPKKTFKIFLRLCKRSEICLYHK